jgi:hypothetical protein
VTDTERREVGVNVIDTRVDMVRHEIEEGCHSHGIGGQFEGRVVERGSARKEQSTEDSTVVYPLITDEFDGWIMEKEGIEIGAVG